MTEERTGVVHGVIEEIELAPEPPPSGIVVWARENLFSTVFNSFLTIFFSVAVLAFIRAALSFFFSPERRWEAVTANMKLLMVQSYPSEDLVRIWTSVGIFFVLVAFSMAVWKVPGNTTPAKVGNAMRSLGGLIVLLVVIYPYNDPITTRRIVIGLVALAAAVVGHYVPRWAGERAKQEVIPVNGLIVLAMVAATAFLFTAELPFPDGQFTATELPIADSTRTAWVAIFIVSIVGYYAGRFLSAWLGDTFRKIVVVLWLISYPVIVMVIMRKPILDWGEIVSNELVVFAVVAVVGGAIIWWLARPGGGEGDRLAGIVIVVLAFAFWLIPESWTDFVLIPEKTYLNRFLFAAFAAVAAVSPSFGGTKPAQRRMVVVWVLTAFSVIATFVLGTAETALAFQGGTFLGGFNLSILLAITGVALSFPLGVLLALGRTSSMPIFRLLSTGYIELIRSVPLITWLFFASVFLALFLPIGVEFDEIVRIVAVVAIFSAAYIAETVRGGLQSVQSGQYEAARSMGLTTVQSTSLIVLPQAIRAVIPALVGGIIVAFKDTSLVAIVGLFDFLLIAQSAIPTQSNPFNFLGTQRQLLMFAALFYWVFTFTFSRLSLRVEKRLGLGEGR